MPENFVGPQHHYTELQGLHLDLEVEKLKDMELNVTESSVSPRIKSPIPDKSLFSCHLASLTYKAQFKYYFLGKTFLPPSPSASLLHSIIPLTLPYMMYFFADVPTKLAVPQD